MEKLDGDGYLHADKERGVSLRPPDELQLTNMNEPERQELDARTKKRKMRENGGDPAEEELPPASPSLLSSLSSSGMEKPYGSGFLHADSNEQGVSLRPPHEFELMDMNQPERLQHELDARSKKRKMREKGEDSAEEEAVDLIEEKLALRYHHQGLGATLQYLRETEDDLSSDEQVQIAPRTVDAPRNRAAVSGCSINDIPLAILDDILRRMDSDSIRNAISSSFIFVRAAMCTCECDAFRENGSFIAGIVQPSYGRPSVAAPERDSHHPLSSAAIMLDRFITLRYTALHWHRIIDSRKGYVLIERNHRGNQFDVMRLFMTMRVVTLPLIDLRQQEELITATIVPESSPCFVVMMLSREGMDVTLREFRSRQGMWIQQRVQCSLIFRTLPESRRLPLYASDKLYLLDAPQLRVLCFSHEQNLLDSIRLPASVDGACVKTSTLSRTRDGQVCWAALDHSGVTIFALDGVAWRKKRRWPVPQHFYSS